MYNCKKLYKFKLNKYKIKNKKQINYGKITKIIFQNLKNFNNLFFQNKMIKLVYLIYKN